jgi:hypothetical protein
MRKLIIATVVGSLLVLPVAGASAKEKIVHGSFEAQATPMPGWPIPGDGCMTGPEGLHRVSRRIEAPFSGWLYLEAGFSGDWELGLFGADGSQLAQSDHQFNTDEPTERITYYVRRGQEVDIAVCNAGSASIAKVDYTLVGGRPWVVPAGERLRFHTERVAYKTPSIGTNEHYVFCHSGFEVGCPGTFAIEPTDRWLYVEVEDSVHQQTSSRPAGVSAEVYQYIGNTYLGGERFCTATDEAIRLKPGVDFVGISIDLGPCEDGQVAAATQGAVKLVFTNQRI